MSDLAASAFAGRATRRFGIGPTIVWAEVASAGFALLIPFAGGPLAALYLFVPQLLGDGLATASGINALTLRQLLAPPEMLGRVNAAMHVLIRGIAPVSAIAGALIAEALGIRTAVWITVLGIFGGALLMLLPSPLLRPRQPQDVAPNLMSETSSTRS